MTISNERLPSSAKGWEDGLGWLEEIEEWSLQYEEMHMVPAPSNIKLADAALGVVFINVPSSLLSTCKKFMSVLLGPRLRKAMMYGIQQMSYSLS